MKFIPLSDPIFLPLSPTIAGAIVDYLQSISQSLYVHSPRNCDNVDTELPQDLFWYYWYFQRSIRQVPTLQYQYVSTIAHRLAAKSSFTPLEIWQKLQLSIAATKTNPGDRLELGCWCNDAGYIYFELTPQAIATWLNYVGDLPIYSIDLRPQHQVAAVDIAIYAHARCRSLLKLAHTEKIVEVTANWQLHMPDWSVGSGTKNQYTAALTSIFEYPAECRLIQVFMAILDEIYDHHRQIDIARQLKSSNSAGDRSNQSVKSPNWTKLTIDLAQSWLDFYRDCRIFGDVKSQNPHLAIARCGLTAIAHRYLQVLLENYLGVRAVDEL
jgi:DALR anticodon binding domain